jgi:hypothetical protein
MIKVRLFAIPGLAETQQVIEDLQSLSTTNPHELVVIDISKSPDLMNKYGSNAPVLLVGPMR